MANLVMGNKNFFRTENTPHAQYPYLLPFVYPEVNKLQHMYLNVQEKINKLEIPVPFYMNVPMIPKIVPHTVAPIEQTMGNLTPPHIQPNVNDVRSLIKFEHIPTVKLP